MSLHRCSAHLYAFLIAALAANASWAATSAPVTLPDSARYEGETRDGLFNGQGTLIWRNGQEYQGAFKDGLMHGAGKLEQPNGDVHEGDFVNGMLQGRAQSRFHNGDTYTGEFKNGAFEGKGLYRTKDKAVYEGDFKAGDFTGKGTILWTNGNRYTGEVRDWRMAGTGVLTMSGGDEYRGKFEDEAITGKGEIHYKNGNIYKGIIDDWLPEGAGEFIYANGDRYLGEFQDGYFHGKGTLYYKKPKSGKERETGEWEYGNLATDKHPREKEDIALRAEAALSRQQQMVTDAVNTLAPGTPGTPDLYFVSFGGDGKQDVFMKEARYTKQLFENGYGAGTRALALYNSGDGGTAAPLATTTNLRQALTGIAAKMNRDEDILFLYLTSHGSKDHVLSVALPGLNLPGLSAAQLAGTLRETGIKWKVIVISACYSGGFLDPLKDGDTLIISSARRDRVSFGCSDDAEFTYFGRAYFTEALPASASFIEAFETAKKRVAQWEKEDDYEPSSPQIATSGAIAQYLDQWSKTLPCGHMPLHTSTASSNPPQKHGGCQ